ncbi:CDP-alcohol phosphatidyltransferase family protein [candidate division KSB1 bacterium]|nr:MAG: CDP-alcohol phosphatidyltransferase family protein [candidate division KSB1 bacterium]
MKSAKGLIPAWLTNGFVKIIMPMVHVFVKLKLSPNFFTTLGFLITTSATVVLFIDPKYIHWFGLLVLLGGICDVIDGKLARTAGRSTKFGALYDSSLDRYSEVIMFFGIAAYYVRHDSYLLSVMSFIALGGSMMVSYIRARAEGLGFTAKVGWMQRAERVVIIGFAALLNVDLFKITMFHVQNYSVTLLDLAIWTVAIFANVTALQRLYYVYVLDKSQTLKEES